MLRVIVVMLALLCSLSTQAQSGTWSGKIDIQGTQLPIVFHLDGDKPTMDSPRQGAMGIPIKVTRNNFGSVEISVPAIGATYRGMWLIDSIVGSFNQNSHSLPLTLTPGDGKPKRPQTPVGPYSYNTTQVSFANGDITLHGTLTTPKDATRNTPALVMITGSGQQNRDEEIAGHKPFAVIADALAKAGIATLRYDDRCFGNPAHANNYTTEDFKLDALAAITLLRTQFDRVGAIGHSEGGTIALMLAAEQRVDFIISLAGMVISGSETLIWQNRNTLLAAGLDTPTTECYCSLLAQAFAAKTSGGIIPTAEGYDIPDALARNYRSVVAAIQMPYMAHFISLDVRPLLQHITSPVLALNGTKDCQVEHTANLSALRSLLPQHPKSSIEAVEGLNHLFQPCTTGASSEYQFIELSFSPELLERIVHWVNGVYK
ncbi:MAG: alpha/beta fold hydrolase [Alistipes sp.]|nr:alpha/beta fold hydrolase [Alistipes sp.]